MGRVAVVKMTDRGTGQLTAKVAAGLDVERLRSFVQNTLKSSATLYTDTAQDHRERPGYVHEAFYYGVGGLVYEVFHTNKIGSFGAMLKRDHRDIFHGTGGKRLCTADLVF